MLRADICILQDVLSMTITTELAESFVHAFHLEKSPRKAALCLMIWGLLHLLVGSAYFYVVAIYDVSFSFWFSVPFIMLFVLALVMIKAAWYLLTHP